jgi:16S rRNA (cytidine1402-2'-O)-methyltransferase
MPGTLFVVATPIGNLEDVTARALRILREASIIAAEDTRRTAHLLARYAIETPTTSLHEHNEFKKTSNLIERLKRGDSVALVSDAGTPTISDPGGHLIRAAIDAGIKVEAIPGPNAAVTALAASGAQAETFLFLGFPPTRAKDRKKWLTDVRNAGRTVVFYEAPHRLRRTLEEIRDEIGDLTATIAREITKVHEELVRGPISGLLDRLKMPRGEYTVVLEIPQTTEIPSSQAVDDVALANEFGELTKNKRVTRKEAVGSLANKHHLPRNQVYSAIERGRKSGK